VGAYASAKDNYQHAIVSTDDGALHEIYFDPLRGIFRDELGCFGKVVATSAFFTADDGLQHAIVGTADGSIREVFFDPSVGIHVSEPALAVMPGLVGLAAFYAEDDKSRIVLVATSDGNVREIFYSSATGVHVTQPALGTFPGVQSIAGFYTARDKYRHAIVATRNGDIHEIFYHPSIGVHVTQPALASFPGLVGIAGFASADDGYMHVIVATQDGAIHEIYYHPSIGVHISQPALATVPQPTALAGYFTPDGYRHVIVGTADGQVRELFYNPQKGIGNDLLTAFGDVGVTGVELNQAIQDLHNHVPLFAGKRTLARVYLNAGACSRDGPALSNVEVIAAVFDKSNANVPVWGPVRVGPSTVPRTVNRDRLADSVNFELPALGPSAGMAWSTTAAYALRVTSLPVQGRGETRDFDLRFYDSVPLHFRPFYDNASGQRVSRATLDLAVNRLRAMMPTRDIVVHDYDDVMSSIGWPQLGLARTLALAGDQMAVSNGQQPPNCSSCFFITIPWVSKGSVPYGLANPWPNHDSQVAIDSTDINWSTGTLAQEPGHNIGRLHASTAHSEQAPSDPDFPYAHGEISDNVTTTLGNIVSRGRYYGADPGTNPAHPAGEWWLIPAYDPIDGTHHHDYMSYGAWVDIWTSDYSYFMNCGAYRVGRFDSWYAKVSDLPVASLPAAPPCKEPTGGGDWGVLRYGSAGSPAPADYLIVGGTLHPNGRVDFEPSFRVNISPLLVDSQEPDTTHHSSVRVEFRAADNTVLESRGLYPPSHGKEFAFTATLPWSERISSIVITKDGRDVGRSARKAGRFRVALAAMPKAIQQPTRLSWTTTPSLTTSTVVLFSSDGGKTWRPVALGIKGTSYVVQPGRLPGTTLGRFRLLVSDGINSESVESTGVITVRSKAPAAFISEPAPNAAVPPGGHLLLRGTGLSMQSGLLEDEQLSWFIDDQRVGHGRVVEPTRLAAGQHRIRLEVVDAERLKTTQSVSVTLAATSAAVVGSSAQARLPSIGSK
jgi:hypothetical protein